MRIFRTSSIVLGAALAALPLGGTDVGDGEAFLKEDFESLDRWEPLAFARVPRHSVYAIETRQDGGSHLLMRSENAGSAMVLKTSFDPSAYPIVEWRWRVDEAIEGIDHARKSGDDYPVRVYLFFEYTGTGLGFRDRLRYRAYRALRGEYPPHSGLAFVWTANPIEERTYPNPYTGRVGMRVLRGEETPLGEWRTERIHALEEYHDYFGEPPPDTPLRLAIMTDSDDTGQATRAAIDAIRILRQ